MKQSVIAFFDFDGTVTRRDSYLDFIRFACGEFRFVTGILALSPFIVAHKLGFFQNDRLKEKFFGWFFAGKSPDVLQSMGKRYTRERLPRIILPEAMQRIQWHQEQGHRVIILTASSPIWLAGWCSEHKVELIGTQFEVENGAYTGKILGKNCHGEEKRRIVLKYISSTDRPITYGYGDDKSDWAFLREMDHGYFRKLDEEMRDEKMRVYS